MKKVFSVYDQKAESYGAPTFLETEGMALRAFSDVCADVKSPFAKYPEDFSLHLLGEYEPNSGKMIPLAQPKFLYSAASVVSQLKMSREEVDAAALKAGRSVNGSEVTK